MLNPSKELRRDLNLPGQAGALNRQLVKSLRQGLPDMRKMKGPTEGEVWENRKEPGSTNFNDPKWKGQGAIPLNQGQNTPAQAVPGYGGIRTQKQAISDGVRPLPPKGKFSRRKDGSFHIASKDLPKDHGQAFYKRLPL